MVKTTRKKSYHGYEARLETFSGARLKGSKPRSRKASWPHARPSATQVAKAGFYFTPSPSEFGADLVTCYMCGCGIDGWEPEDDPLKVHAENCESCPLAMLQSKPWENDPDYDPRCDDSLSTRLQTYYQPLTNEELEEAIMNADPAQSKDGSPTSSNQLSTQSMMLMGTSVWPHDDKSGWIPTSESMAKAGFYYFPNFSGEDFALCPYCGLGLDGWEPTDEPVEEHQRRSPHCLYFTANSKIPLPTSIESESHEQANDVDAMGYESTESTTSTASNKRKKKATAATKSRKRVSKRTSKLNTPSDLDESDASTSTVTSTKRKRGRPSKKAIALTAATKDLKKLSSLEDTLPELPRSETLSASIMRTSNAHLTNGSVSARISAFEGFAADAAKPFEDTTKVGLSKASSLSKVKPESRDIDNSFQITRAQTLREPMRSKVLPKISIEEEQSEPNSPNIQVKQEESTPLKIKEEPESPAFFKSLQGKSAARLIKEVPSLIPATSDEDLPMSDTSSEIQESPTLEKNHSRTPELESSTTVLDSTLRETDSSKPEEDTRVDLHTSTSNTPKKTWSSLSDKQASASPPEIYNDDEESDDALLLPPKAPGAMSENWACYSGSSSAESRSPSPVALGRIPRNQKAQLNLAQLAQNSSPLVAPRPVRPSHSPSAATSNLTMPPKMPLNDTSSSKRNTTPPPPVFYDDHETRPPLTNLKHPSQAQKELTPTRLISPQAPNSPPIPMHAHYAQQSAEVSGWTSIDPDMVFDLLATSTSGDGHSVFDDGASPTKKDSVMDSLHLDKTVREWVNYLADESENRLKANCDALIEMLEKESQRAVKVLEALPVRS